MVCPEAPGGCEHFVDGFRCDVDAGVRGDLIELSGEGEELWGDVGFEPVEVEGNAFGGEWEEARPEAITGAEAVVVLVGFSCEEGGEFFLLDVAEDGDGSFGSEDICAGSGISFEGRSVPEGEPAWAITTAFAVALEGSEPFSEFVFEGQQAGDIGLSADLTEAFDGCVVDVVVANGWRFNWRGAEIRGIDA